MLWTYGFIMGQDSDYGYYKKTFKSTSTFNLGLEVRLF